MRISFVKNDGIAGLGTQNREKISNNNPFFFIRFIESLLQRKICGTGNQNISKNSSKQPVLEGPLIGRSYILTAN